MVVFGTTPYWNPYRTSKVKCSPFSQGFGMTHSRHISEPNSLKSKPTNNNKYVRKDLVSWWEKQDFQSKMNSNTTVREHWWGISSDLIYSVYLWKLSTESGEKQSLLITLQIWTIKEALFLNISGKRNNILWSGDRLDFRMKQFHRFRHLLN